LNDWRTSTPDALAPIFAKLDRAGSHLTDLQAATKKFVESDFYEVSTELRQDGRVVGKAVNVQRPGPELGAMIGDLVHGVRSALDQLIFQLATAESGPLSERMAKDSAFPIFKTGPRYRGEAGRGHGKGRGAAYKIRGLSPPAQRSIERLQPYHRRKHPLLWALWMLEELSNIDKHRLIPLTGALPVQGMVEIKFNRPGVTAFGHRHVPGPIEEGKPILEVAGDFENADDIDIEANLTPSVIFDKRCEPACVRGWPIRAVIDGIFTTLAVYVFPELNPHIRGYFGTGINFAYGPSAEQLNAVSPVGLPPALS
jgi:hypothetical protein